MLLPKPIRLTSLLVTLAAALCAAQATAQDSLDDVLQRVRIQDNLYFSYRETRHLQLMMEPWLATGDMHLSPQQMVIAQHKPTIVTTVITRDQLTHDDSEKALHRTLTLEQPFAVPGMEPFMQLLYGTAGFSELEEDYEISFSATMDRWQLNLEPRWHINQDIARMQLSGDSNRGADHLVLLYKDTDRTEWQLSLVSQGTDAAIKMQRFLPDQQLP